MDTKTIEKRRSVYKSKGKKTYNVKKKDTDDGTIKSDKENDDGKKKKPKKFRTSSEDVPRIFRSGNDLYDTPLQWWETEPVKYAINYPPVKLGLETIMGTHIVRLTDRKYMLQLMAKISAYNVEQQKIRIEKRKISPPSIISRLLKISAEMLSGKMQESRKHKIRLFM